MTTDRDGDRSNPYRPDPERGCCPACVFGHGQLHAKWCPVYKNMLLMLMYQSSDLKRFSALPVVSDCRIGIHPCLEHFTDSD